MNPSNKFLIVFSNPLKFVVKNSLDFLDFRHINFVFSFYIVNFYNSLFIVLIGGFALFGLALTKLTNI